MDDQEVKEVQNKVKMQKWFFNKIYILFSTFLNN
jgi:hypothetical protein